MGIPKLNRFLLNSCSEHTIQKKHLSSFAGKTIVIDTSIYMYKFSGYNALIENMYLLVNTFKYYKMIPIFIFDGKPPQEKKDTLKLRQLDKQIAESKCADLKLELLNMRDDDPDRAELIIAIEKLKKQFVRISQTDTTNVKSLLNACGVTYYDAPGEADQLCAKLVISKVAWACLSDDMDMFIYGCTRVMRHASLINHTVIFYNINGILRDLEMPMQHFREIAVISGTDYNISEKTNLHNTLKYYKEYKSLALEISFYEWLNDNTDYITDYENLKNVCNMFKVAEMNIDNILRCDSAPNRKNMIEILKPHGFVFVS
jgi:5'-3' exonuclease